MCEGYGKNVSWKFWILIGADLRRRTSVLPTYILRGVRLEGGAKQCFLKVEVLGDGTEMKD
jgi:hypothetical protein